MEIKWPGILLVILLPGFVSSVEKCWQCLGATLGPPHCNATGCSLSNLPGCVLKKCPGVCKNLCSTQLDTDRTGLIKVSSFCLPQCTVVPLRQLLKDEQIDGQFYKRSKGHWSHTCAYEEGCNRDILAAPFTPRFYNHSMTFGMETEEEKKDDKDNQDDGMSSSMGAIVAVCVILALVLVGVLLVVYRRSRRGQLSAGARKCKYSGGRQSLPHGDDDESSSESWGDDSDQCSLSTYKTKVDSAASSSVATQYTRGGGSGDTDVALLPIKRRRKIASGRYAKVYEAVLVQDKNQTVPVSVKAFFLRNYGAWRQEIDMLSESWIHHENIIEYYTAEQRTIRNHLEYWLITAYYEHGNLANFLVAHPLTWVQLTGMILSIANGLSYLHAERDMNGKAKTPIAHRDIKSTNILVKDDLRSCVIADFGLSLKLEPGLTREDCANAGQVGTPRYMAPELLERLINLFDPESFKRADVYAMALVIWEMINRCDYYPGMASPSYLPAYGDKVKEYPTKHQMTMLVCKDRVKPEIKPKWLKHPGLMKLCETLEETWEYTAEERITAGCLVERIKCMTSPPPSHDVIQIDDDDVICDDDALDLLADDDDVTTFDVV